MLRGLALGFALIQITCGILIVAVTLAVSRRFDGGAWESLSGLIWAGVGVAGGIGALVAGHLRVIGAELSVMRLSMAATAFAAWPIAAERGTIGIACGLALAGLSAGPIDVALLTLRQRRTDPDRLGRVLAVSTGPNLSGLPIGMAAAGMPMAHSLRLAFVPAAFASNLAAVTTYALIPADDAG